MRQCGACSPRGEKPWEMRILQHQREQSQKAWPTAKRRPAAGASNDFNPFNSAMLELSSSRRRWIFESQRILSAEIRDLEAQIAALQRKDDLHDMRLRECEERNAIERSMLRRALSDAETRAQWYESKFKALLARLSGGDPFAPAAKEPPAVNIEESAPATPREQVVELEVEEQEEEEEEAPSPSARLVHVEEEEDKELLAPCNTPRVEEAPSADFVGK